MTVTTPHVRHYRHRRISRSRYGSTKKFLTAQAARLAGSVTPVTFAASSIVVTANKITKSSHAIANGSGPYALTIDNQAAGGLTFDSVPYYLIVSGTSLKLATSAANALAATAIDITGTGKGLQSLRNADGGAIVTFHDSDVNASTDVITVPASFDLVTGQGPYTLHAADVVPAGLVAGASYFVSVVDANSFRLSDTAAHALAGVFVDLTSAGDGDFVLTAAALNVAKPFNTTNVDATANTVVIAGHGLQTGDGPVQTAVLADVVPGGLATATDYYLVAVDANTLKLASSKANALANTAVDITDAGSGQFRLTFQPAAPTFASTAANTTTDVVTLTAHPFVNGQGPVRLTNSGGSLPAGLATATDYFVIFVDANSIKLATSQANALAGTAVDITAQNTGTNTVTLTPATDDVQDSTINVVTDAFTVTGHKRVSGEGPYRITAISGTLPAGLAAVTNYWAIFVDADTIKLATSQSNALVPTPIDITNVGTGYFKLTFLGAATTFDETAVSADDGQLVKTAHGFITGDGPFLLVPEGGGTQPAGTSATQPYYVHKVDADTIKLAVTRERSINGPFVSVTSQGSGTLDLKRAATYDELAALLKKGYTSDSILQATDIDNLK